jgi:hypothetical protein
VGTYSSPQRILGKTAGGNSSTRTMHPVRHSWGTEWSRALTAQHVHEGPVYTVLLEAYRSAGGHDNADVRCPLAVARAGAV